MEDGRTTGGVARIEVLAVAWQADVRLSPRIIVVSLEIYDGRDPCLDSSSVRALLIRADIFKYTSKTVYIYVFYSRGNQLIGFYAWRPRSL